jgi:aminopeptidase N
MYGKGTWVIQMLRARMGEQAFWNMLAELRRRYERKNLTTEQFRDLCAEFLPPGASDPKLRDFFDQWVYGMGIPSLKLSTKVSGAGAGRGGAGNFRLNATLSQSGVPDDFSADFPVRIELRGKQIVKWVQSSSEPVSFSLSLSSRPEHVSLDPDDQFLKR